MFRKLLGAAIGFIVSGLIVSLMKLDSTIAVIILAFGTAIGFLSLNRIKNQTSEYIATRAEVDAESSGRFTKFIIKAIGVLIIIVAVILLLSKITNF